MRTAGLTALKCDAMSIIPKLLFHKLTSSMFFLSPALWLDIMSTGGFFVFVSFHRQWIFNTLFRFIQWQFFHSDFSQWDELLLIGLSQWELLLSLTSALLLPLPKETENTLNIYFSQFIYFTHTFILLMMTGSFI